jgi:predicted nucleotidyltransferase
MAEKISKKIIEHIREYVSVLRNEIPVNKVILFGSYARGKQHKSSDVDIAIISEKFGINPHEEGKYLFRKLWKISFANIDPMPYSPNDLLSKNPSPLLAEIKKYGIVIAC